MKMRITASRGAPIVRNIAMSRVFARTSMISDEMMLNEATRMINDRITNIAKRSIDSASNRSEEHTSELPSLMRNPNAVFCLKKKTSEASSHIKKKNKITNNTITVIEDIKQRNNRHTRHIE